MRHLRRIHHGRGRLNGRSGGVAPPAPHARESLLGKAQLKSRLKIELRVMCYELRISVYIHTYMSMYTHARHPSAIPPPYR